MAVIRRVKCPYACMAVADAASSLASLAWLQMHAGMVGTALLHGWYRMVVWLEPHDQMAVKAWSRGCDCMVAWLVPHACMAGTACLRGCCHMGYMAVTSHGCMAVTIAPGFYESIMDACDHEDLQLITSHMGDCFANADPTHANAVPVTTAARLGRLHGPTTSCSSGNTNRAGTAGKDAESLLCDFGYRVHFRGLSPVEWQTSQALQQEPGKDACDEKDEAGDGAAQRQTRVPKLKSVEQHVAAWKAKAVQVARQH
eukprot:351596-Chlamydomonas_euryale.AAC.10